jgi:pSer/pThr/pTyr-binding forkhead associated (FHA) protein
MAAQDGFEIARPSLGTLRLSTGTEVPLDRGVIFGRAPDAPTGGTDEPPNLVQIASPENDISRSHAEIILEGWNVYVRDLGSTNGTFVISPGSAQPQAVHEDLVAIEAGWVINLANEVAVRFDAS